MDVLSGIFPEWPPQELEIALENAGQDINMAVEILLELPPPSQYQHQHHPEHRGPQRNRHKALEFSPTPSEEVLDQLPDPADEIFADWGKSTDVSDTTSGKKALSKDEAIANLLSLFPDACTEFLTENYQKNHILHGVNIVEFLANKFLEGGYTRAELVGQKRKRKSEHDIEAPTNPNYESPDRPLGTLEYRGLV
jgi:hypothetical protein